MNTGKEVAIVLSSLRYNGRHRAKKEEADAAIADGQQSTWEGGSGQAHRAVVSQFLNMSSEYFSLYDMELEKTAE